MDVLAQHALQLTRLPTRLQQEGELSHTVADAVWLPVKLGDTLAVSVDDADTLPVKLGETLADGSGSAIAAPPQGTQSLGMTTKLTRPPAPFCP